MAVWRTYPGSDRQHGDTLSEQGGRDQVQMLGLEGQGNYSLVSDHGDCIVSSTYLGTGQCRGGSPLSVLNRECSPIGVLHQMVSRSQGNQPTLRYFRPTYSRSVRHSAEQQGRGTLFTPPRPSGFAGQLPAGGLVQGSTVDVSPSATPVPCSSQGDQGRGSGHCDSTVVAAKRVVLPTPAAPSGPASDVARAQWSSTRPRRDRVPQPQGTLPSCVETLGRSLRSRGVSREAAATICAAHRPSTRALYHAKWRSFCCWCSRQEKNPLHPSIRMVLSYLQHLRRQDFKHSTIISHISALNSCTNKVDGVLVGRHPLVARCVLGDRAQNPPCRSLVPRWNLSVVLAALIEKLFEPLR